jgi:hypothetical protein
MRCLPASLLPRGSALPPEPAAAARPSRRLRLAAAPSPAGFPGSASDCAEAPPAKA